MPKLRPSLTNIIKNLDTAYIMFFFIIDIDAFKNGNDTNGHPYSDKTIKLVVHVRKILADSDIINSIITVSIGGINKNVYATYNNIMLPLINLFAKQKYKEKMDIL